MDEQEKKITQYLIPANVSTKFEFFAGFGWYELKIVGIALAIGVLIFFGLGLPKKTVYVDVNGSIINNSEAITSIGDLTEKRVPIISPLVRSFAIIIPGASAFFLVKKDPSTGMSLISTVKGLQEFKRRQKLYLYKYGSGADNSL